MKMASKIRKPFFYAVVFEKSQIKNQIYNLHPPRVENFEPGNSTIFDSHYL
jgi:membrane carboxypeptidase/penicillin-binding protein PbpC